MPIYPLVNTHTLPGGSHATTFTNNSHLHGFIRWSVENYSVHTVRLIVNVLEINPLGTHRSSISNCVRSIAGLEAIARGTEFLSGLHFAPKVVHCTHGSVRRHTFQTCIQK